MSESDAAVGSRTGARTAGTPARTKVKVRHYEVDEYGHVNHANYLHYLEVARVAALESLGLRLPEMRRQGMLIVAVELTASYHAPAWSGDPLDITTSIRETRGARSFWTQEIREASSQRLIVTAELTLAFVTETGQPVRTPAESRNSLAKLQVTK